jgi:hypothetical protein
MQPNAFIVKAIYSPVRHKKIELDTEYKVGIQSRRTIVEQVAFNLKPFFYFLKKQLNKIKKLTISGEICIGTNSRFTGNINEIENSLKGIVETIKKDNPYLKVESKRELYELNFRIFAYHKLMIDHSLLENLHCRFQSLLDYGNRFDGLTIRLNVYGELHSFFNSEKFRYINQQTEVAFMNNESSTLPWLPQKFTLKQIGFIVFVVLLIITVVLLVYFNVIPLFPRPLVT